MRVVLPIAGGLLVAAALRDIFHTLFHPRGHGGLSEWLPRLIFRGWRRWAPGLPDSLALAGPSSLVAVVLCWLLLTVVGTALVLTPFAVDGLLYAPGLDPSEHGRFLDALYVSLVSVSSVGYGDVVAEGELLRLVGPLSALIGLALVTASISWILSTYRVFTNSRSLAADVRVIRTTIDEAEMLEGDSGMDQVLAPLRGQLATASTDLSHFPITWYFRSFDPGDAVVVELIELREIARRCSDDRAPRALQVQARLILEAIDELARLVDRRMLRADRERPAAEVLTAWRRQHLWPPLSAGQAGEG